MAVSTRLTAVSEYLFRRLFKVLFRYDIFISYARRDGKGYALKLKEQLTRLDFSCFLDYDELPVGNSLNKTLKRALKKSAALVVIGTEGALKSRYVELEVGEFTATGRAIIPVDFEGTLADSPWSVIKERDLVWVDETKDALAKSTPSPPVADSVDKLFKYTRRNVRVRGQVIATALLFVLGAAASIFLIQRQVSAANVQRRVAEAARITAQQEQGKAEAATRDAKQQEALATASAARALEKEKEASEKTEEAKKQAALARAKAEEAKQQQLRAEEQQKLASSRQLSANALSQLKIDPELSLVLAGKSADTAHTVEAEDALRKALLESHVHAVVEGQRGNVSNASFSADGEFVVVAGDNNTAKIMRLGDGKIVAELREQTGPMTGASFSPDGKLVVTANEAGFARVWDWRANRVLLELAHPAAVDEAFFSHDGASIITIGGDNAARIWDAKSGRPTSPVLYGIIAREYHGNKSVRIKPFSVDGQYVFFVPAKPGDDTEPVSSAAAGKPPKERSEVVFTDGRASIWDVSAGRVVPELEDKLTHVLLADINVEQKLVVTYRGHPKGNGPTVLWDLSTGRRFAVLREEDSGDVNGLALSPDGSLLVTAGQDGAARVWKIPEDQDRKPEVDVPSDNREEQTTLNRMFTLNAHSGPLRSASFSPNGRFILTTSDDHTARVWDVKTGLEVSVLRGHSLAVLSAAFSPNGDRMITSSDDHTARVWDGGMGQGFVELQKIGEPERVVFGARSNKVLFNQGERTVRVWDASVNAYLPGSWPGHMAAISATGQTIVTVDQASLHVYDMTSGGVRFALEKQSGEMLSAVYSSDGTVIATAESDNFVRIRDAATGKVLKEQPFLMSKVASLRFSPGNSHFLLMTSINNAMVWDWRAGRPPIKLPEFTVGFIEELGGGSFSPDGTLVVGPRGQLVSVWDARSGCRLRAQFLHQSTVHGAGFSQDGRFILSTDSYAAKLWQLPAGLKCEGAEVIVKEIASLDHSKTGSFAKRNALLSPDGKFIVVTSISAGPAQVHNVPTGNLKFKLGDGSAPTQGVAMSSNGRLIVTAHDDGKARVWDAASGTLLRTLDGEPGVPLALVSFSLDDKLILTASDWRFNLVTVWDADTGKRMGQSFPGHLALFSPDGRFVVVGGGDHARISDVNRGGTVAELKGLTGKVTHVVFSDDDQRIIAATSDRKVGVWEAISGRQIARREYGGDIESLAAGPGGRFVVTTVKANSRSAAEGWDLQTDKTIKYDKIEKIGLSPDGKFAFTVGSGANNTKVMDVNSGAEIADLPGYLAAYSSDGKLVAAISDNVVHIVDANSWQTRLELRGHSEHVTSAVFSPDGKFLVTTAYREAAAIVWNVGSGAIETRLFGNTGYGLLSAAFSADGKSILVVGDDQTARLYRCVMCGGWDELIERARERFTTHARN